MRERDGDIDDIYNPEAGIFTDFETLLTRFSECNSVRYEKFAEIWRDMKMSMIFSGRQTQREVREFIDECFKLATRFWMPPYSFQVRIGSLYLLYGLYETQPYIPRIQIRVTLPQWLNALDFLEQSKTQGHLDVEYIFNTMRVENCFQFVHSMSQMLPTVTKIRNVDEQALREKLIQQKSILSELFTADSVDQLAAIQDQYHRMKCELAGSDKPHASLDVVHGNVVQYITKILTSHEEWRRTGRKPKRKGEDGLTSESEGESDTEKPTTSAGDRRASIKQRAYTKVPEATRSRRHRKVQSDSDCISPIKSPKTVSPIKSPSPTKRRKIDHGEDHASATTVNYLNMPNLLEDGTKKGKKGKKTGRKKNDVKGKKQNKSKGSQNATKRSKSSATPNRSPSPKKSPKTKKTQQAKKKLPKKLQGKNSKKDSAKGAKLKIKTEKESLENGGNSKSPTHKKTNKTNAKQTGSSKNKVGRPRKTKKD